MNAAQKKIQTVASGFNGKTIKTIDASSANMWTIYFTDGSFLSLETEHFGYNIHGIVPDLINKVSHEPAIMKASQHGHSTPA